MKKQFLISPGPHVRGPITTGGVMYEVMLALLPAAVFGISRFGAHALLVLVTAMLTAVLGEHALNCFAGRDSTFRDGSAALTGLLLGLTLPAGVPLYVPFAGALFAVFVVKGLPGGLGKNRLNPALCARCFLSVVFRETMTVRAAGGRAASDILHALIAHPNGLIGCSSLALLLGGLFLLLVRVISWRIPVSTLLSCALFSALFGGGEAPVLTMMAGGVIMTAFFIATDPVTSPVSDTGKLIYGGLVGLLAALGQRLTGPAEAAAIAVLLADLTVPFLDKRFVPKSRAR